MLTTVTTIAVPAPAWNFAFFTFGLAVKVFLCIGTAPRVIAKKCWSEKPCFSYC